MTITPNIVASIERTKSKIKKEEARDIPLERQADSAFLHYACDLIDRTALAICDELEKQT
uniref:Uncharacterized protein n=1 Tax=viral metagenome TaxID=1070528 RepID=A0A6M3J6P7_9ZZZZ